MSILRSSANATPNHTDSSVSRALYTPTGHYQAPFINHNQYPGTRSSASASMQSMISLDPAKKHLIATLPLIEFPVDPNQTTSKKMFCYFSNAEFPQEIIRVCREFITTANSTSRVYQDPNLVYLPCPQEKTYTPYIPPNHRETPRTETLLASCYLEFTDPVSIYIFLFLFCREHNAHFKGLCLENNPSKSPPKLLDIDLKDVKKACLHSISLFAEHTLASLSALSSRNTLNFNDADSQVLSQLIQIFSELKNNLSENKIETATFENVNEPFQKIITLLTDKKIDLFLKLKKEAHYFSDASQTLLAERKKPVLNLSWQKKATS